MIDELATYQDAVNPTPPQPTFLNDYILDKTSQIDFNTVDEPLKKLGDIITDAAKVHPKQLPDKQKRILLMNPPGT